MTKKSINFQITLIIVIILYILSITGCLWSPDQNDRPEVNDDNNNHIPVSEIAQNVAYINSKALDWLDTLEVDPIKLRYEMGIKGKKKFVELLDVYLCLYETCLDEHNQSKYKDKLKELVLVTYNNSYHDLSDINDTQFRQDSTSYLRAWYIMNEIGLNTTHYENEIDKIITRLDAHLPSRGVNQRMAFVLYYKQLVYPISYTMDELFNQSQIRDREEINNLSNLDIYFITHEIFMLYDDEKMELLLPGDIEYLTALLPALINITIADNNVDLLAELIMIMTYLNFTEILEYDTALEYLLNNQNNNGSFGYYEDAREYYQAQGIDIDIYLYLHTTEVSLRALNEAVYIGKK